VYKAVLRDTGEEVAIKVQRPGVEPVILRDLFIFRSMARFINPVCKVNPHRNEASGCIPMAASSLEYTDGASSCVAEPQDLEVGYSTCSCFHCQ